MIHLDANVLIRLAIPGSGAARKVRQWLVAGEALGASAPAWFEYISGPVSSDEVLHVEALLTGGVQDFQKSDAMYSAELFNLTGRRRSSKLDCMIAASALGQNARLATTNVEDFKAFADLGLNIETVAI